MTAPRGLNYGQLMNRAMRGLMAEVLGMVADSGLPGEHHFYISFDTAHPGVDIPGWLRESYPDEMTIVLQEWFADLVVTQDRFSVTLNFSNEPQTLVVPFAAVRTFVDPSVKFGLKFDAHDPDEDEDGTISVAPADPPAQQQAAEPEDTKPNAPHGADVVSLDKFRKH